MPPPLPPIPEALKSGVAPKGFGRLFDRIKFHPDSPQSENHPSLAEVQPSQRNAGLSSVFGRGRRRPSLKTQISNPELQTTDSPRIFQAIKFKQVANANEEVMDTRASNRASTEEEPSSSDNDRRASIQFRLAEPRLSPMEYARLYLLEQARSAREGRPCELPAPRKLWRWTPKWEHFVIIPALPSSISRSWHCSVPIAERIQDYSDTESMATPWFDEATAPCPRLSLNLGGMSGLFPSMMNLAKLSTIGEPESAAIAVTAGDKSPQPRSRARAALRPTSLASISEQLQRGDQPAVTRKALCAGKTAPEKSFAGPMSDLGRHSPACQVREACLRRTAIGDAEPSTPSIVLERRKLLVLRQGVHNTEPEYQHQEVSYDCPNRMVRLDEAEDSSLYSVCSLETAVPSGTRRLSGSNLADGGCVESETEGIVLELQPAPLDVRKKRQLHKLETAESCSRILQRLSLEINERLAELSDLDEAGSQDGEMLFGGAQTEGPPPLKTNLERQKCPELSIYEDDGGGPVHASSRIALQSTSLAKPTVSDCQSATPTRPAEVLTWEPWETAELTLPLPLNEQDAGEQAFPDSPTLPAIEPPICEEANYLQLSSKAERKRRQRRHGVVPRQQAEGQGSWSMSGSSNFLGCERGSITSDKLGVSRRASKLDLRASSFAMDREKGNESITLLPQIARKIPNEATVLGGLEQKTEATKCSGTVADEFGQDQDEEDETANWDRPTPLTFQRFDTATRLASAVARRDYGGTDRKFWISGDRNPKSGRTSALAFSSLFRKYSRNRMENNDPMLVKNSPPLPTPELVPEIRQRTADATHWTENASSPIIAPAGFSHQLAPPIPTTLLPPVPTLRGPRGLEEETPGATYKGKKPHGLRVETRLGRKLQKAGRGEI